MVRIETKVLAFRGNYLRTNIPTKIAKQLDIQAGDILEWDIDEKEEIIIIRVRHMRMLAPGKRL
jgi:bifunctional DNA-binding transcriptional regulator/antitoxin component of YhaV-PrlF toxin-antitoxin module